MIDKKFAKNTFLFLAASLGLQYCAVPLEKIIGYPPASIAHVNNEWHFTFPKLRSGPYFLSVGRVQGICDLNLNSKTIDSQKSEIPERQKSVSLGTGFMVEIDQTENPAVTIACTEEPGFPNRLLRKPVIASFYLGAILQILRLTVDVILGPFFSIILLFLAATSIVRAKANRKQKFGYLVFAAVAAIYCMSLAQVFFLYLPGHERMVFHILLRNLFALAFSYFFCRSGKLKASLVFIQSLVVVATGITATLNPESLYAFYTSSYLLFPVASAVAVYSLTKDKNPSPLTNFKKYVAATWVILQSLDSYILNYRNGPYSAPPFITIVAIGLIYFLMEEIRKTENQLVENRAALENSLELSTFASQIAHDIRSPLLLLKALNSEVAIPAEYKGPLDTAISRILSNIQTLLRKSRATLPQEITFSPSNEPTLLIDIGRELKSIFKEKSVLRAGQRIVWIDAIPNHPVYAHCQRTELNRVVSNVIDNALEAIQDEGYIEVSITDDKKFWFVLITDTGAGLNPETLAQIGKPGVSTKRDKDGGLGLFHAINATKAWGGLLSIDSVLPRGTRVTITVPKK